MSDIFISYASADRARVKPLVDVLERQGWSVWWDRTIRAGQTFDQVIEAALAEARCAIVLWSGESVKSHWVLTEAEEARQLGILVPARLEEVIIPLAFRRIHAADLIGWQGALPHPGVDNSIESVSEILPKAALVAGQVRINPIDGQEYVWIPPGRFTMGCSSGNEDYRDDETPHEEKITRGFWMGRTPVTQAAYEKVMQANPSHFRGANLPVEKVTWDEAQAFSEAVGLRLPTETEWEYAARAGSNEGLYGSLDQIAWYRENSGGQTHLVASKDPNAWGLHDMLGNVWEWCNDWIPNEGELPEPWSDEFAVLRGSSWDSFRRMVRVSLAYRELITQRFNYIGFRCAGELPKSRRLRIA